MDQVPKIKKLEQDVVNRIAAGEIIQRPANALKELIENSLDAKSTTIQITAKEGGLKNLQIQDNGTGIRKEDMDIVCVRFTTSKLVNFDDLRSIATFGFRGEALASISHVASLTITTKTALEKCAYRASYVDGKLKGSPKPCAGNQGTCISIDNLFYNVPTRRKALSNPSEELAKIAEVVTCYAVHNPTVAFMLKVHGQVLPRVRTPHNSTKINNIKLLYDNSVARELMEAEMTDETYKFRMHALITNPNYTSKRMVSLLFINHRLVDSKPIRKMLEELYSIYLPKKTYPWCYLSLEIDPRNVDVNVHPTKHEVRFLHEDEIIERVRSTLDVKLSGNNASRTFYRQARLPQIEITRESLGEILPEYDQSTKKVHPRELIRTSYTDQKLDRFNFTIETEPKQQPDIEMEKRACAMDFCNPELFENIINVEDLHFGPVNNQGEIDNRNSLVSIEKNPIAIEENPIRKENNVIDDESNLHDIQNNFISDENRTTDKENDPINNESLPIAGESHSIDERSHPSDYESHPIKIECDPIVTENLPIGKEKEQIASQSIIEPPNLEDDSSSSSSDVQLVSKAADRALKTIHKYYASQERENSPIKERVENGDDTSAEETKSVSSGFLSRPNDIYRREVKYLSILTLRKDIEDNYHEGLRNILSTMIFVGCVDDKSALVQSGLNLYICDTYKLSEELFYEIMLYDFQNYGLFVFSQDLPIVELALMGLSLEEAGWTEEDGPQEEIAKRVKELLLEKADLLREYFSITIDKRGFIKSLPVLLDKYTPYEAHLPLYVVRLATEVDWTSEKECFDSICRETARFYSQVDKTNANWKHVTEHVLYRAIKDNLLPPKHFAHDSTILQIAALPDLYKVFERC